MAKKCDKYLVYPKAIYNHFINTQKEGSWSIFAAFDVASYTKGVKYSNVNIFRIFDFHRGADDYINNLFELQVQIFSMLYINIFSVICWQKCVSVPVP